MYLLLWKQYQNPLANHRCHHPMYLQTHRRILPEHLPIHRCHPPPGHKKERSRAVHWHRQPMVLPLLKISPIRQCRLPFDKDNCHHLQGTRSVHRHRQLMVFSLLKTSHIHQCHIPFNQDNCHLPLQSMQAHLQGIRSYPKAILPS